MSWQQEKRALQETVIALREMLCRMAQRQPQVSIVLGNFRLHILTLVRSRNIFILIVKKKNSSHQTDYRGEDGWNREQVESQLRAELEESQKQLKCAHNIQQEHKSKIQSLRYTNQSAVRQYTSCIFFLVWSI